MRLPPERRRTWPWIVLCVLLAAATASSWIVASRARTEQQRAALSEPPPPSVVTARVETGELVDEIVLEGVLGRENTVVVKGPPAGGVRPVVTSLPMRSGDVADAGDVLAEVSGRPVIALKGAFPAYRDLTAGDTGRDVRQLQTALGDLYGTPVTGTFDARTVADVKRLYQRNGYRAAESEPEATPDETPKPEKEKEAEPEVVVPAAELSFLKRLPATVAAVSRKVGDDAAGQAVLSLASGGWQVTARIGADDEERLDRAGDRAAWSMGDGPFDGRKATLRGIADLPRTESRQDEEAAATRQCTVRVSGKTAADARVGAGQQVTVTLSRSPEGTVVVPVSALWTGSDGRSAVTVAGPSGQRSVPVEVVLTVAGRAAVEPAEDLPAGTDVVVAFRNGTPDGG
ncbi:hypothetical protein AB0M02_02770 [Actinoplanes sp. NPDC051861]|uniref:hypothetical protein n=1 Tax=Actinoplanes sp. NPDC051861 TaxID=3155170 RepID=UPI0034324E1D